MFLYLQPLRYNSPQIDNSDVVVGRAVPSAGTAGTALKESASGSLLAWICLTTCGLGLTGVKGFQCKSRPKPQAPKTTPLNPRP